MLLSNILIALGCWLNVNMNDRCLRYHGYEGKCSCNTKWLNCLTICVTDNLTEAFQSFFLMSPLINVCQ